jgi:hypothetical protein
MAWDIVEAIRDRRHPKEITLPGLMESLPVEWAG